MGTTTHHPKPPKSTLTRRELEVLWLLIWGNSTRQVAQDLAVSPKTIESHVDHIKTKAARRTGHRCGCMRCIGQAYGMA